MKELNRFRKFLTEDKNSISGGMLLSENAPGYDTRKFGKPLPTLESVQAAHEAKVKESEDYLGKFDFYIFGSEYDFKTSQEMGSDPTKIYYDAYLDAGTKEEMIALAKQYAEKAPNEAFIVAPHDDWFNEVWSSDSINEGHKHTYKQIDPDGTAECTKCGLRNSDPSKTGEKVRAGVRSAAEKLGMKPSHIKEEERAKLGPSSQFTFEPNDPKKDLMIHTIVDEYQDKIFDYLWNYELYKNEYSKDFGY